MHVPTALATGVIICHVLHSRQAEAETKGAIKYAAWEPLCLLTKDAVKLYGMAHKLNLDIDTYLYRSEADQVRLQVLLSRSENAKLQAAAAATIAAIQTDKAQVADKGGKCKLAAATLAAKAGYLHGRIAEFLEVMTAHRGTTNGRGCLSKSTSDDAASLADTVAAVSAKCQLAVPQITTTESKPTQLTLSGFPKLTDSNGITVATDVGGSSNAECKLLSTTNTDVVNDGDLAEAVPYAAGYMRRNMAMTAEGDAKLNSLATDPGADAKTKTNPYYSLWEAYKEADGCRQAIESGYTRPTAANLAGKLETKSAIKNYVLQKEGKYDQATDKEDDYKNLDKIFKDGKDFYPQKLWDAMDKKDVAKDATGEPDTKKLADITDISELHKVLLYYTRQKEQTLTKELKEAQEKATQANQNDAAAKAAEDACNKLEGQEKCNADPKCSYEIETGGTKKCTYNATKAAANGATVTQPQSGGAATVTEKCKDKKKDDCKDGCKWEGETCKDSSILATKKFALSVVSAAFVALLF